MNKTNWDKVFSEAHLNYWPLNHNPSLCISNSKPKDGRNLFVEDKKEILAAASKYGYVLVSKETDKSVSFVKRNGRISDEPGENPYLKNYNKTLK